MTFSGGGSYCKDTCDYDEYIDTVYCGSIIGFANMRI